MNILDIKRAYTGKHAKFEMDAKTKQLAQRLYRQGSEIKAIADIIGCDEITLKKWLGV